jgi:predicted cupin superfamily sugar epimerase
LIKKWIFYNCSNGFEQGNYFLHFGARCDGEHVTVKMDGTALVFGVGIDLVDGFQKPQVLISNEKLCAGQPTLF